MLVHDFDDERTLEEEELLETTDETNANEIEDLERASLAFRSGALCYPSQVTSLIGAFVLPGGGDAHSRATEYVRLWGCFTSR